MIRATYRLQLRDGVDFDRARALVPYLARLGVSHLYLSPIFHARRGSSHGYDVVDPGTIDPTLGTEDDYRALVATVRSQGMGVILDIVPNHLATGSENRYWEDVLTWGRRSRYAEWFDIHWEAGRRIFLPVLGDWLPRVLERGELSLAVTGGRFRLAYYDDSYPVAPSSVPPILDDAAGRIEEHGAPSDGASRLRALGGRIAEAAGRSPDPGAVDHALDALRDLATDDGRVAAALRATCAAYGRNRDQALHRLLAAQPYRLAYWRRAAREINYRRFFTISHLVAVRQERDDVFEATHRLVMRLAEAGLIDGVRVDHVDGLLRPRAYLERLREALTRVGGGERTTAVWVEKILASGEELPTTWPVLGTTGYEFLNAVDTLSLDPAGWDAIELAYRKLVRPHPADFAATARQSKRMILTGHVTADVARLARRALRLGGDGAARVSGAQLGRALIEVVSALERYRVYVLDESPWYDADGRSALDGAFRTVEREGRAAPAALELLARMLLVDPEPGVSPADVERRLDFARRVGQLSVTAAAKGVEDTAVYRYVPLVVLNEVGSEPDGAPLAAAPERLHAANERRQRRWPGGLLSTSTHDTKRSADTRARLAVLSELPAEWLASVRRWRRMNASRRGTLRGRRVPDANLEYLFYQTAVGIWPDAGSALEEAGARIESFVLKAAREAKVHTSWARPNEAYEEEVRGFVRRTLDPTGPFVEDLSAFVHRIARAGCWNALGRTLLHLTAPGVPDIYQGDELWRLLLVDPDNRRPVDFARRSTLLDELDRGFAAADLERRGMLDALAARPEDGRIKLHTIRRTLAFRRDHGALFAEGAYVPVSAEGPAASHVVAFARNLEDDWTLTIAPRLPFTLTGQGAVPPMGEAVWRDTALRLPDSTAGRTWRSVLTGDIVGEPGGRSATLLVADVLRSFPVALLASAR